jgi:hypothetical protein
MAAGTLTKMRTTSARTTTAATTILSTPMPRLSKIRSPGLAKAVLELTDQPAEARLGTAAPNQPVMIPEVRAAGVAEPACHAAVPGERIPP